MMELETFAVAVYSKAGVAEACLALQDQYHADVPLLLFCGWYGTFYGRLTPLQLDMATEMSKQLSTHVIKPLRQARRWMKNRVLLTDSPGSSASPAASDNNPDARHGQDQKLSWSVLREQIKSTELRAELLLLDALAANLAHQNMTRKNIAHQKNAPGNHADIQHNLNMMVRTGTESDRVHALLALISAACVETALMA